MRLQTVNENQTGSWATEPMMAYFACRLSGGTRNKQNA